MTTLKEEGREALATPRQPPSPDVTADLTLDRREAVPAVIGDPGDFLFVSGLAGAARDVAQLTGDGPNSFLLGGAMGAATSIGLGLALAARDRRVLVVTGEGELLMGLGCLATIAVVRPANLSILVVDNASYGETGYQATHTATVADLEMVARGAGIERTLTVRDRSQYPAAAAMLRAGGEPAFVVLRTSVAPPPAYKRNWDAAECRYRFRHALRGA